ncbi:diguanylate cyclase (GGDEF)-like protein [Halopolyspora algeriensis]|uniref:Diguanylate cyclase (GGDEF)-like protein n=1 Tax=Halopolyspora algeriensis TaxID=1500506 RepID=A0A368VVZ3_9ACTN|nr:GGDEF domain-containing phosphodiesterase [Halopolyspora algeriensis]RCW46276.1 diguanylate cyclase (GGDEF)-like protein [Halopolyspora algeriensis]TQM55678.1 diguanylate cyclase (GGDEF)-like protein [Halopolyspora algeriensis]
MASEHTRPDVVDSPAGDELSGWMDLAEDLALPHAPVLLTTPGGIVVRATEQAAELAGQPSPAALLGQCLTNLVTWTDPTSWLRRQGKPPLPVREASWPHTGDERLRVTLLVDVSNLVTDEQSHMRPEQWNWLAEAQRFTRMGTSPLQEAQQEARIGTWEWNPATGTMRLSGLLHELSGIPAEKDSLAFDDYLELVPPEERARVRESWTPLIEHHQPIVVEHHLRVDNGTARVFRVRGMAIEETGVLVGTSQDVTDQYREERTQLPDPSLDTVTGLRNRAGIHDLLEELSNRSGSENVAILSCKVDNVERITTGLGHEAGDELLAALARRLTDGLPDVCTAARLFDQDVFVVLCLDLTAAGGLEALATRLSGLLRTTVPVHGHLVRVSASIGVALPPGSGTSGQDLLRFADAAMLKAQQQGPDQVALADPDLITVTDRQLPLEEQLQEALRNDELALHYQPLVASDGTITGAEALLRWPHPEHGLVSPGVFLPVARRGGLLRDIDRWVLRTALHEAAGWPLSHGQPVDIGINLSGLVPGDSGFIDLVTDAVAESGIEWHRIVLELVETDLVDLSLPTRRAMENLTRRGVRFAIDDFGTGYSSLARLKGLPAQEIKIARQFTSATTEDTADLAVTRAIADMAHALGRRCVAEGVETAHQLQLLSDMGVESYQGWLFSPALPADEFRTLLTRDRGRIPAVTERAG